MLFQNEIEQYNFEESETFWYKLAYNINLTVPCKNKHRCTYCKIQDLCFALEWTVLIDKAPFGNAKKTLNFNFCWKSYISTFQLRAALAQVKKKKCFVHQDGDSIRSSSTLHIEVSLGIIQKPKIALMSLVCVWQKMNSMFSFVWLWLVEERNIWVSDETRENATQIPSVYHTWYALYSAAIVRITHLDKLRFFVIFLIFSNFVICVCIYFDCL